MLLKLFLVTLVAMFPLVELRGAIPIAAGMNLPVFLSLLAAMLGNMIPMPFIFTFGRELLEKGAKVKYEPIRNFCKWCIKKGNNGSKKLWAKTKDSIYIALLLFVGIPLPGTGAWTGALIASVLGMNKKKAMLAITIGVFMASIIMMILSYGLLNNVMYH